MWTKNNDYMVHIHLQESKIDVTTITKKHNNFNNLCFRINETLFDNFTIHKLSQSKKSTINNFMKEYDSNKDIVLSYIYHKLNHILFNISQPISEWDFIKIIAQHLHKNNSLLLKEINSIIKATVARCHTSHWKKHWAENTVLQTLKDLWYTEEELNGLSNNKLKLILKHHKLNQTLTSLNIPLDMSSSLQEKRNIIKQLQQEDESNIIEIKKWNEIIIKKNKKRPKKPLIIREKIPLSKIHYHDEDK
jgi:hypothetical protein